jgi:hypothetical protein
VFRRLVNGAEGGGAPVRGAPAGATGAREERP